MRLSVIMQETVEQGVKGKGQAVRGISSSNESLFHSAHSHKTQPDFPGWEVYLLAVIMLWIVHLSVFATVRFRKRY